ncbi:MAG: DUF4091 domain-containing protein [Acidobacteria bacterium]|nr:MAG: DUF4091 domain-containing protein [Acidobacteriota bacterium]
MMKALYVILAITLSFTALSAQPLQYHVVSANDWLYPDTQVPASPLHTIDLHSARGARTAFQVLLQGTKAGDPLQLKYEGKLAPELYQLVDVNVPENSGPPCSAIPPDQPKPEYSIRKAPYRVYEALRPIHGGDKARGETEAFYVSFRVPTDATPGKQNGQLRIQAGERTAEVKLSLTVHTATVPEQGHLRVTNWFSLPAMARLHKLEPWSEGHWEMIRRYARMMRRGRQTDFIPVRPEVKKTDQGGWQFDFSRTERMIKMFLDEGFTHIELPHIAHHDRRKEAISPFVVDIAGTPAAGTSREAYAFLSEYLKGWAQMLRRNGWYDKATQHVVDEPNPKNFADYRIMAGTVRKFLPGIPLIDALGNATLDGAVDIWVPLSESYEKDVAGFEAHRRRGDIIWFYTCCDPSGYSLNRFIDTELLRTRLLHWANWKYRLDGYLHWGLNQIIEEQHPFENTCPPHGPYKDFHLPPGDSHIVYPGEEGPWSSVRFEAMSAGIEDYELLRLVGRRDEKLADEICTQLVRTFTNYDSTVAGFDAAHRRLLEEAGKEK